MHVLESIDQLRGDTHRDVLDLPESVTIDWRSPRAEDTIGLAHDDRRALDDVGMTYSLVREHDV